MMSNYKCTINEISFFDQLSKNQEKTIKKIQSKSIILMML